ncbi:hypothetical protein K9N68_37180 (plasmid) [Kovacikia minuta CCNUW1]|uniref:hypothetical protein n=1 Tax=Kovacikia minuta TaxID=2931930 RepID=UPI001CCB658F|nr:hypothetical protein [Kovacikia minuta]UBF29846.1 hypothetical protein K9N68_37180 [Kovacikia minuta CCNUW1]
MSAISANFPGNVTGFQPGIRQIDYPGFGVMSEAIGVCDITPTPATVFDVKFRSGQVDKADSVGLVIPTGSIIHFMGFKIPTGLIATNGDRLKLATAVGATGTQAFNADGSTAYVASAVAASNTFASTPTTEDRIFKVDPYITATVAATNADLTFKLFNDNGTTGAGSGVSVASGTKQIAVVMRWLPPNSFNCIPSLDQIQQYPARA